jgi:hypothetical protein
MIAPSVQQKVEPFNTEMIELERLIGIQDELTISGLCKGIDTTEFQENSRVLRVSLEGMKARSRKQAGRQQ